MKPLQPMIAFFTVVLTTALCCHHGSNGGNGVTTPEPEQPIGTIALVRTRVEAGRSGQVQNVDGSRDFYDNESVRVRDNGKGKISFNDGSSITLYNDTSAEQVVAKFSPPEINLVLIEQGFEGYVPQGSSFTVNMPNGSQVKILGTQFFVIFDPGTNYSIVGNFDGTVLFTPPGGSEQELPPHTMVDIAPDGGVNFLELPYGPANFESAADSSGSPVGGVNALRDEFGQPQPGGGVATEPPAKPITTVIRHLVMKESDSYLPDLAESWGIDPDGYIVEFHLRPNIFLPDSSPFTASVVAEILKADWAYALEGHVTFEIVDDLTIVFHLDSASAYYVLDEMSIFEFEVQLGGPG